MLKTTIRILFSMLIMNVWLFAFTQIPFNLTLLQNDTTLQVIAFNVNHTVGHNVLLDMINKDSNWSTYSIVYLNKGDYIFDDSEYVSVIEGLINEYGVTVPSK